ncbi:hypothetical protein TARUN_6468 [Trichoderma arundinaceum]|uniref:Uncharacterized protein n=1 Tax=Trichoderma arundinaceum TaxID=490622 RepID=A0A395NI96_TRIAR|nr:hypothetical protein TARUN_6468 [Trichoderma arundinaceum]
MRASRILLTLTASAAAAQRPTDVSICDYYTKALLKENTAENQLTLLTLLVNTVVIGNYTAPNVGVKVPGILAPGHVNGKAVNLLPYFNGQLASTNTGGSHGESVNFLDGGGAAPLMKNKPANDNMLTGGRPTFSFLLTHLYQFFGSLLSCTQQGMPGFPAYGGRASLYQVHKFMALDNAELTYFIQQIALAAQSFGVATSDIEIVGNALSSAFGMRCATPTTVIKAQGPQLQAVCIESDCPLAKNAKCSLYEAVVEPCSKDNATAAMTLHNTKTPTGTQAIVAPTAGAVAVNGMNAVAVAAIAGAAAFAV